MRTNRRSRLRWAAAALLGAAAVLLLPLLARRGPPESALDRPVDGTTQATPYERMSEFTTIRSDREILFYCSNSMRLVMERIAAEFQRQSGIAVVFTFGGGSELLPLIQMGGRGDLFICHDPYAERLETFGRLAEYRVVGRLVPVILVPRGNPLNIGGLSDLGRPGLRVATVDRRYATAGQMIHAVLDRKPWGEAVRENIRIEARGHSDAVLSLLTGHVDAAVVWSFLAALYADRVDRIDCGVEFPEEIRVTLCRLTTSENASETQAFLEFIESEYARKAFSWYGYREAE